MSRQILISGFEPFGGEEINPSALLAEYLASGFPGETVEACLLPVEYFRSFAFLSQKIQKMNPDLVVMLGQGGGRAEIQLERVALNLEDSESADNAGIKRQEHFISDAGGPEAFFNELDLQLVISLVPAPLAKYLKISNSAGTYVCNSLYYKVQHALSEKRFSNLKSAIFIHVPYCREQVADVAGSAARPFLELDLMQEILLATVSALMSASK